tara:strand:+ start:2470 stop:2679 length:210 start_codon:yes stop_codon:yes gene_type:complete
LSSKGVSLLKLAERKQMELNFDETLRVGRVWKMSKAGLHIQGKFPVREELLLEKKLIGNPYRKTPTCCG